MSDYVWYAAYGSNLSRQRFLCYITGGRPAFGKKSHRGSKHTAPPVDDRVLRVSHALYFALPPGKTGTENWGEGGVAFMDPEIDRNTETICRIWKITREQYDDVRTQEGPVWYDIEIPLGEVDGIPILTVSHGRRLEHVVAPSPEYLKTIALGLRESSGLSSEQIVSYFMDKTGIKTRMRRQEVEGVLAGLRRGQYTGGSMKAIDILPPTYFYVGLLAMVVLHFILPLTRVLGWPWRLLGIAPLIGGAAMAIVADSAFKKVGTSVKPTGETTTLVTTGMFRISRHPMYLGFVLFLLGTAMLLGTLTPFLVAAAFAVLMEVVFVRFEEKKMEDRFGDAWREYKRKVRRWI